MLYKNWFGDTRHSKIIIISDHGQREIAAHMLENLQYKEGYIHNVEALGFDRDALEQLEEKDYVIVILSYKSFIMDGYNQYFTTFRKPKDLRCNYVFVRLDITFASLCEGLSTDDKKVLEKIENYCLKPWKNANGTNVGTNLGTEVRVTAAGGTDISFCINQFKHFNHFITPQVTASFLPPSEIYGGILLGSANGQLVVDLTIGQLYKNAELLEKFGLVNNPVKLTVVNSRIVEIEGSDILKEHLMRLEPEALTLVELGIGLSRMTPTGNIGIDESLEGTCHFGIGDGTFYGIENRSSIHLDVVIKDPHVEVIMEDLMKRLRENKVKYQCYEKFIEGNPFLGYVAEGRAFLFRGESDGPWVYFVADTPEEFRALLPHLTPLDKQFALVEDYMLPDLLNRGDLAYDMCCMRLYLPEDVTLDESIPEDVTIRPLTVEDVPFMYANYIYADSASADYFELRVKSGASLGVVFQGQLVGWVLTHDDGALGMLHVLDAYRGHGYAEALTKHLCLAQRAKGILPHLAIKIENQASMGLAKKIGFVEDRVIHWLQFK